MRPWLFPLAALLLPTLAVAAEREDFHTPSGNVWCVYEDEGHGASLVCSIRVTDRKMPQPAGCRGDLGHSFQTVAGGAKSERVCTTEAGPRPTSRVLPYGQPWKRAGFFCHSAPAGLNCYNDQTAGFELSRASQRLF